MGKWVHRLLSIDPEAATGECAECGRGAKLHRLTDGPTGKARWVCDVKYRAATRTCNSRKQGVPDPPEGMWAQLLKQGSACLICRCPLTLKTARRDHDHVTGKFRGLLCDGCNSGLGFFKDSMENLQMAIWYLKLSEEE